MKTLVTGSRLKAPAIRSRGEKIRSTVFFLVEVSRRKLSQAEWPSESPLTSEAEVLNSRDSVVPREWNQAGTERLATICLSLGLFRSEFSKFVQLFPVIASNTVKNSQERC